MRHLLSLLLCCLGSLAMGMERPNVPFIGDDDPRVEPLAIMPNIDRLAKRSRVFTNAHCQQAVCNPSRASLMTGLRPDTLRIWNLETHFRKIRPGVVTLPQHFKADGYTEWRDLAKGGVVARELYDHTTDPKETRNLAGDADRTGEVANLAALLPPPSAPVRPVAVIPPVPGSVIHHQPAASGLYIGSPSLCVLPDGSYLASHDLFGPRSNEYELATGRIYRSTDRGATWRHLTDLKGFFWTNLFVHRGAAYAMGTDKHHGRLVIRRSDDAGTTWSAPSVIAEGQWHTAPVPVVEHGGRLWRAVEDAHTSNKWGERYRARMVSIPTAADLLVSANWTFSNPLARDPAWLEGRFAAWLEGNAVVDPQGCLVNMLRVDKAVMPEYAAMIRISPDGGTATFDSDKDFIGFPGGGKKFTIRKDPAGAGYWTIASIVLPEDASGGHPAAIRNTLALTYSKDLRNWEIRCLLLRHPDVVKHGFQYVDWQFDGKDLIAACRTAWDDVEGGAHNNHDANFLTFHRWQNFRNLTRGDDAPLPEITPVVHETAAFRLTGSAFEIGTLANGGKAFSNRDYLWQEVPPALAGKWFTRLAGGGKPVLKITAKADLTVRIAAGGDRTALDLTGWTPVGGSFCYTDAKRTRMELYTRSLKKGEALRLPSGNWTGAILIFD
jgi:hypothetical protein